jgi:DNA-binding MarR family transcriptional regulator
MNSPATFFDRGRCNCGALRRASRRLSQMYDEALAPVGLRASQFALINELARRGDVPPTIGELADALAMDHSTMGQNLRPLEREGFVALARDEADGRRRCVTLTPAGRERLPAALPLWQGVQDRFEAGFGEQAAAALRSTLFNIARDPRFADENQPN